MQALRFSAAVEIGTGLVILAGPGIVVPLLLGVEVTGTAELLARLFGFALLCLGLACWPERGVVGTPPFRTMLLYNAAIAMLLIYLAVIEHYWGALLVPAAVLHIAVAVWMSISRRKGF